ncbi:hypothetical protein BsWGS_15383 [Bradybaena similaris]
MAEFNAEAASLGLFHEIFSHLSSKSADDHHRDVVAGGSSVSSDAGWKKNGFGGGLNRVDDPTAKQHSFSKSFLQSSLLNNKIDNGVSAREEYVNNNNTADLVVVDSDDEGDDSSGENVRQKNVQLDNLDERTFTEASSNVVVEGERSIGDDSDDCENIDDVNVHIDFVNGSELQMPNKKKGVSFPKDTIISGYLEPPDPWKNAPSWTTNELVSAYKKSCEMYGAKPISQLLRQLQTFSPANSREEVLSLKGEKLDQKQCECIEEILKRVRFKLLDFEASHLDDECAVALFDMIEFYESGYQLNIAFNRNIQARGWQACSRLVRRTPELSYLDLRNCDLNERTIPIFGRALKLGCHLTILHLENMSLSGRPLIILVAALKMNETLQELFLADNKLLPTDGIQLGNLLHYNHKLALLDLRNNHLQDVGTNHICEGLTEQNKGSGLRTLVLWNNSINYQAMSMLGRALASSQNMETLNIGHNAITNEGVYLLKDGLLRVSSLLRLGLQGTRISDEGAVALAEYIAESLVLLRIDLRDNDIKTGGLMALSHAMRVNTSITRIDLDKDPKKEPGIKDYVEQQNRLLRDIITFQQRNVQVALQKEEEKRSRLQEKAEAELAIAKKEANDEQQGGHLPANASTESFTLIDELPVEDEELDKDNQYAENPNAVVTGKRNTEENASPETSNSTDDLDSPPHQENGKLQQRPTVLFPRIMLPPQATLDSPVPISGFSCSMSVESDDAAHSESASGKVTPVRPVTPVLPVTPPAEIILSPQYFPKQIARKIFSVSRVSEDGSLSSSPTSPVAFDPLCVAPLPLIPVSSTPILLPPTVPVLQCVERVSQHSKMTLQMDSANASLFQHLAEETMKHMISPDIDVNDSTESASLDTGSSNSKDSGELRSLPVENGSLSDSLKTSDSELADLLQAAASSETLTVANGDIDVCDNVESLVDDAAGKLVTVPLTDSDNSEKENFVINAASVGKHGHSVLVDSSKELLTLDKLAENPQHPSVTAFTSQEFDLYQACTEESQDSVIGNNCETHSENDHNALKTPIEAAVRNHIKATNHEENLLESEQLYVHPEQPSELSCNSPFVFVGNATETEMKLHEMKNSSSSVKDNTGHQLQHALYTNSHSSSHSDKKHSSCTLTDVTAQKEVMVDHLINLSLHSTENIEELLFPFLPEPYMSSQSIIDESDKSLASSLTGLQKPETGHKKVHITPAVPSANILSDKLVNESLDDQDSVDIVASDHADNENVDLNLDEEPWLTVGVDVEGTDTETSRKPLKQPDFFTTLSMNGLAQELASALTSFDGTSNPFEVEDYNIGS